MSVRMKSCKRCGDIASSGSDLCTSCELNMREKYLVVKDYLYEHPGADAVLIAKATAIDEADVLYMIDNKWLERDSAASGSMAKCMVCGRPSMDGSRMCTACKQKTQQSLEGALRSMDPQRNRPAGGSQTSSSTRRIRND